jgi:hypothetical protein
MKDGNVAFQDPISVDIFSDPAPFEGFFLILLVTSPLTSAYMSGFIRLLTVFCLVYSHPVTLQCPHNKVQSLF